MTSIRSTERTAVHFPLDPASPQLTVAAILADTDRFPRDPSAPVNVERKPLDRTTLASLTRDRIMRADIRFAREREAAGATYARDPRAFLADVAPELSPAIIARADGDGAWSVDYLTEIALRDLMSNES